MFGKSPYCVFSFGGGVQSSAIYLMLIHETRRLFEVMGEVPDRIYFADTGAELESTYECLRHMQNLRSSLFQIEVVNNGSILEGVFADAGNPKVSYPFFIKNGQTGKVGMSKRMCTSVYKIQAIQKAVRKAFRLTGLKLRDGFVSMWLGISIDEIERMKDSPDKWVKHSYPLIELGMTRQDCIDYCNQYNWMPTKSRCYFCPYQSDVNWAELKRNNPEEFELACKEDERIRNRFLRDGSKSYLHRSCIPLREMAFKGLDDIFTNECEGLCNT